MRTSNRRRPASLTILGVPFSVHWDEKQADAESNFGETDGNSRRIDISTKRCGTEGIIESTVLHEALHAILFVGGHDGRLTEDEEERIVLCLEHGMYPVVCDLVSRGFFAGHNNKKTKKKKRGTKNGSR